MPKSKLKKKDNLDVVLQELEYRVRKAERRHGKCNFYALVEEVGEVACDIADGRNPKGELLDLATAAIRLAMEEE